LRNSPLYDKIVTLLPSLSPGQRAVARYVVDHDDTAAFMNSTELGQAAGVSDSTVIRFARALGYRGYLELKRTMHELVRQRITPRETLATTVGTLEQREDYIQRLYRLYLGNVRQTFSQLDSAVVSQVIATIDSAPCLYIMGTGVSAAAASFLAYRLRRCRKRVVEIIGGGYRLMAGVGPMEGGDLLLAIDVPRYSPEVTATMKYARNLGATTVLITDSLVTPMQEFSDYTLTACNEGLGFTNSAVGSMCLAEVLSVGLLLQREDEYVELMERLENLRRLLETD